MITIMDETTAMIHVGVNSNLAFGVCFIFSVVKRKAMAVDEESPLKLYSFWASTCAQRVRIALNLKGLNFQYKAVDLLKGEHLAPEYLKLNPVGFVPTLVDGDVVIADSFAIIMYLEEKYPQRPLLPTDLVKRAINHQVANIVSSSIQPLQNLIVEKYLEEKCGTEEKLSWIHMIIGKGFLALEKLLTVEAGKFATGDQIYLADLFLAPQLHRAIETFNVDMSKFPILSRLYEEYKKIAAFEDAAPENQPDAPSQN
ncbi:glutathione S-transferase 2-like [Cucumis melo var. makuwa]|uniref:glutathione transferase n=2 Tax=Cucumis melo TaxID=3656 RepID=A0A5A7TCB5_CUCMM|nr:glutathione S-transferase 2-like [Cucumis melo var. makuwa]TYK02059.1 glutathione S-transferase 2-like [Cucumis melo var. makuwa]